jgi:hypothetical protein
MSSSFEKIYTPKNGVCGKARHYSLKIMGGML